MNEKEINIQELIEMLQKIEDKTKLVYVWQGYDAGYATSDFQIVDKGNYIIIEQ